MENIDKNNIFYLALMVGILLVIFVIAMLAVMVSFNNKKNNYLLYIQNLQEKYKEELLKSQLEIQEQTLKYISWELHDNIGQLLTVAKINMNKFVDPLNQKSVETADIISSVLSEIRDLSKSLNSNVVKNFGFVEAVKQETERIRKYNLIAIEDEIIYDNDTLSPEIGIILFRIIQEFITNTIKHADATLIRLQIVYTDATVKIQLSDNGKGFLLDNQTKMIGSGLSNFKNRAELIGAELKIESSINTGTTLDIIYKIETQYEM